jgi:phenylacetate-CoA ligase
MSRRLKEQIMSELDQQVAQAVAYAYHHAQAFAGVMDYTGLSPADVQSLDDLQRVPITSRDALIHMQQLSPPFGGWLAVPVPDLQRVFVTPGPIFVPQSDADDSDVEAARKAFEALGVGPDDIVLNMFLHHVSPVGLVLDEALRRLGATVLPLAPDSYEQAVMSAVALRATVFAGAPTLLEGLFAQAEAMDLPADALALTRAFFTLGAYPPALRRTFEEQYGLRTARAYSAPELGLLAFERPGQPGLYVPETLLIEVCDPENGNRLPDGELGEVVVTRFSRVFPLVRYGTGDLSVMERDDAGRSRLKRLYGRSDEAVKLRGRFFHGDQLRAAADALEPVAALAAIVTRSEGQDFLTLYAKLAQPEATPAGQPMPAAPAAAEQAPVAIPQDAQPEADDAARELLMARIRDAVEEQAGLRPDVVEFVDEIDASKRLIRDERR